MSVFTDMILVLVVMGGTVSVMNDLAGPVFGIYMADSGFHLTEDKVTEYTSSTNPTTVDDFTWTNIILIGLKALVSAVIAVVTIVPTIMTLLGMFGVDPIVSASLAMILQGPIWWVTITGWFEWSTGRSLG